MKKLIISILAIATVLGCSDNKRTLHIFSWADYTDPQILIAFENKFNCHVCIDTFDSNESMFSKLKAGASGYDICVPSSYMISQMVSEGMIDELDHSKIQNVKENFDHSFDSQIIDHTLRYSIPYAVTYTGLMCLKDKIPSGEVSWSIYSDKNMNQKMSMLDDIREVIGLGLMYNGFSLNSENPDEISKSVNTILQWKDNIRKFDAESYKNEVASKSLYLGQAYSTDSFQIIVGDEENGSRDDIVFVFPKEGFTIAWDEMVIMRSSENKDLAYKFINFIYEKDSATMNMLYNFSPIPHKTAIDGLDSNIKDIIIIDQKTLERGQVMKQFSNPKTIELYNSAWDKIKSIKQ